MAKIKKNITENEIISEALNAELAQVEVAKMAKGKVARKTSAIAQERIAKFASKIEPEIQSVKNESKNKDVPAKTKIKVWKIILTALVVLLILVLGASAFYFYRKSQKVTVTESVDLVEKVNKLIELPNEAATIATVTDREKVKDQPFFANAQNGDKALIYTQAKKAILYRPANNKIIEVMYLSIGQNQNTVEAQAQQPSIQEQAQTSTQTSADEQSANGSGQAQVETQVQQSVKVAVNNGTTQKGLAKTLAEKLLQMDGVTIATIGNAKGNFDKIIVVDLTGKNETRTAEIATTLNGEVGSLPEGETKPEADILVIGGAQ